ANSGERKLRESSTLSPPCGVVTPTNCTCTCVPPAAAGEANQSAATAAQATAHRATDRDRNAVATALRIVPPSGDVNGKPAAAASSPVPRHDLPPSRETKPESPRSWQKGQGLCRRRRSEPKFRASVTGSPHLPPHSASVAAKTSHVCDDVCRRRADPSTARGAPAARRDCYPSGSSTSIDSRTTPWAAGSVGSVRSSASTAAPSASV